MDVRGVSREKHAPHAVARNDAPMDLERRHPRGVAYLDVGARARRERALKLFERRRRIGLVARAIDHQAKVPRAWKRKQRENSIYGDIVERMHLVVREIADERDVGERERLFVFRPVEREGQGVAHRAVASVAADDPAKTFGCDRPSDPLDRRRDAVGVLRERRHLGPPLDASAPLDDERFEQSLGLRLRQAEDERIGRIDLVEVDVCDPLRLRVHARPVQHSPDREGAIDEPHVIHRFERPRVDTERLRLVVRAIEELDDSIRRAVPRELGCEREAGRTGPDDEDVDHVGGRVTGRGDDGKGERRRRGGRTSTTASSTLASGWVNAGLGRRKVSRGTS